MASKKKLLTSVVALGTAAALTLGGTFAWQSISQTAVNEASDIVNPGGRLHNDQHWVSDLVNDTNIYVENFTEKDKGEDIYARVRLSEYMEVVMNYGVEGAEKVEIIAGDKEAVDADSGQTAENASRQDAFTYTYAVHDFVKDFAGDEENKNPTSEFFTWQHADENTAEDDLPYYMPTFNKNKDSVAADLNGLYADTLGGISNREKDQYLDYTDWAENDTMTGNAIYDGDSNTDDELKNLDYTDLMDVIDNRGAKEASPATIAIENGNIKLVEETHTAAQVGTTKGLISLTDWLALNEGTYTADTHGNYWVYDDSADGDGWVYWSSPIKAGETTGLLLDGFALKGVMDDTWYYAIDVEAQFVTANDVGKGDNTGFYANGETVTENAEKLLESIGVEIGDSTTGDDSKDDNKNDSDEVVDTSPVLTLKETTLPHVTFVADVEASAGTGTRILDKNGNPVDMENLVVTQAGKELALAESFDDGTPCVYMDGKLRFKWPHDDLEMNSFVVVKLKDTNQFGCISICTDFWQYACSATVETKVSEVLSAASNGNTFKITGPEGLVIVPVQDLNETLVSNAENALVKDTDYTLEYDGTSAVVKLDAKYAGQVLKCYAEKNDAYCGCVIFVDPDITNDNTAAHTLTIEDVTAGYIDAWDVGKFGGSASVVFVGTHDGADLKWRVDYEKVTAHVQKHGVEGATEYTADHNQMYPDSKWNLFLDEIEGFTLDNGALTQYDVWLTYAEDDGTTTTSNKITCTFWSKTVTLTQTGATDSLSKERTAFLEVEGMTMTEAMGDTVGKTDNSFLSNVNVTKDGETVEWTSGEYDTSEAEDISGKVEEAGVLNLEIRYEDDVVIFKPGAVGTYVFTFTINGTAYTSTITVTE